MGRLGHGFRSRRDAAAGVGVGGAVGAGCWRGGAGLGVTEPTDADRRGQRSSRCSRRARGCYGERAFLCGQLKFDMQPTSLIDMEPPVLGVRVALPCGGAWIEFANMFGRTSSSAWSRLGLSPEAWSQYLGPEPPPPPLSVYTDDARQIQRALQLRDPEPLPHVVLLSQEEFLRLWQRRWLFSEINDLLAKNDEFVTSRRTTSSCPDSFAR